MQLIRQVVLFICILLASASYCFGSSPLVSITISPTNPNIPLGLNQQFNAIGTYKNHETRDITASVTWSSSDPAVAIISNSVGSNGLATSVAVGSVVITAVDPSTGISSSENLTVGPPALQSISISPANPTVTLGHSINLSATGVYTDGSIQNVTGIVNWSVANPLVATVDRTGVVTCLGGGESTVTAASGAITSSTNLTVTTTPTALTSIKITPEYVNMAIGGTLKFRAVGIYSDNSTLDISSSANWVSSEVGIATVSNTGLATPLSPGFTSITVSLDGISGNSSLTARSYGINLPNTGQNVSYYVGDDGNLQRGLSWPNPRFTNSDGTTPVNTNVVVDKLTGLMWTQDANAPGPIECNSGHAMNWAMAINYVACLNANNYLGYNDWRLPNMNEMLSKSNYGVADNHAWLVGQGFTNVMTAYYPIHGYWTSTTSVNPNVAADIETKDGFLRYEDKSTNNFVWPIRTAQEGVISLPKTGATVSYAVGDDGDLQQGVTLPEPRFTNTDGSSPVNGDVVVDQLTGLMWANAPYNYNCYDDGSWQGAIDYVACINVNNFLGYSDWRLPNINELMSYLQCPSGICYSSTTVASNTSQVWLSYFGMTNTTGSKLGNGFDLVPVRGGQ